MPPEDEIASADSFFFNDTLDSAAKLADQREAQLVDRFPLSHDVRYLRFRFIGLEPGSSVGLPAGRHLHFSAKFADPISGELTEQARSFSPLSDADSNGGEVEFLVKVYAGTADGDARHGAFSRYLDAMEVGSTLRMSGPWGRLFYLGARCFGEWTGEKSRFRRVGMIAGGAGLAPMIRLLRAFIREIDDDSPAQIDEFALVYTNKTDADVLFREELETYAHEYAQRFRLLLTLTKGVFDNQCESPNSSRRPNSMARIKSWQTFMCRPRSQSSLAAAASLPPSPGCNINPAIQTPITYGNGRINEEMLRRTLPRSACKSPEVVNMRTGPAISPLRDHTNSREAAGDGGDSVKGLSRRFPLLRLAAEKDEEAKSPQQSSDDVLILICGPDEMNRAAEALCRQIGYKHIHIF